MNKYVLRTSLVWLIVFAVATGIVLYRSGGVGSPPTRGSAKATPESEQVQVQPEAAGPTPTPSSSTSMSFGARLGKHYCPSGAGTAHAGAYAKHRDVDWRSRVQAGERRYPRDRKRRHR
jgi:hypothetical protein